ncbi:hypothetical protein DKX38_017313 [Salix brachista]|uniref:Leucine-rich repeat-containing N-terminal plant-type domain-containing protein n=1 Tax=Salix brachista TaxID=2182728 RepID=A0A5N5KUY7_9ROSI|nr:hypothetical protein DKX38_017313 [Salix brachista]
MLMMFQQLVQVCQVMVIISFSSSITSLASDLLPPGEVAALRQIGKTLNEDGRVSFNLGDRCVSGKNVTITRYPPTIEMNGTIGCSCSIAVDKFCHITSFEVKGYDLSGRLPPDLANLTYVERIDFTRNNLYGTIPVEWASMKNLSFISLTANRLSRNIPGYLGNFTGLTYLILSSNNLVGTLPEALAQIKDLTDFRVSDNNLNGTVPEFIGSGLCATGLQGPIPRAIFLLEKLKDLRITDTSGPEFPLLNVPKKMDHLVLRKINLNGTIPEEAWSVVTTLDLTFNKLVGELPSDKIRRQFTFLSGNMLTGTVPESFILSNQYL